MEHLQQNFSVKYSYNVFFTSALFAKDNPLLNDFLTNAATSGALRKILFVVDQGVADAHEHLCSDISSYFQAHTAVHLVPEILLIPGGEYVKNDERYFDMILEAVNNYGIDRHSYIAAIGGGAVLDMAGYAAAVAHRGVKLIRIPTTVLSQNDSGIGVKNSINYFGKKNFLGTFAPPAAVFNDDQFLTTLTDRDWRSGISEAIKVALIKDPVFFNWIEQNTPALVSRDATAMNYLIWRCAQLHMQHIAGADPFESGSSRPLDFGHWSAHKLEHLSGFDIRHGEAVAMGIALDTVYSCLCSRLTAADSERVVSLIQNLGFEISHGLLKISGDDSPLLQGLEEFREHLGGELTITLLNAIGEGAEVNEIDTELLKQASIELYNRQFELQQTQI